ncbi:hypothetical protein [Hymenobacter weizhouensis]|uniref:hypothetical protein n=1 Tax=Hymenobacter sp. YIM 151500-1 TaxID=2987689 RepID=UPI0022279CB9|nr:hypothetical protein [Hymenobacter sp. YIM 151500-1]UYZ64502.1 hypothetical protein OIS53_06535 [Hymenobacter sp. YIM 151500-1]
MKLLNFTLDDQYIGLLSSKNEYLDLHNNFEFVQLLHSPTTATLNLAWQKSSGKWAAQEQYRKIHLLFKGVDYLQVQARNPQYPASEDVTIQHICRTPVEARDEFESIYFNHDALPNYDLLLYFQSEWAIKVNAATVRLKLDS